MKYGIDFADFSVNTLAKVKEVSDSGYGYASKDEAQRVVDRINEERRRHFLKSIQTCSFCGGPAPCTRSH